MNEEAKPARKPGTPNLDRVIGAIERGDYDDRILSISEALSARQDVLEAAVLEQVKKVFGENAAIVSTQSASKVPSNPFVKKATEQADPVKSDAGEIDADRITPDPLEGVENMNAVERRMIQGETVTEIEHRGAIISGLSAADMGE